METGRAPARRAPALPRRARLTAAYVDSSCLVAVLFGEPTAAGVGGMLASHARLFASNLLEAEVCAAARREGIALQRPGVFQDLLWVLPSRPLGAEIDAVLGAGYLRGADLWHVACAVYVRAEVPGLEFLTLDGPQRAVAAALGFPAPVLVA